jgi:hypothetical protein
MRKLISAALVGAVLATTLSACATAPDAVSPSYVSPVEYSSLSCDQIRQELVGVSDRVRTLSGQQAKDHTRDAVVMTVGIVVFWPALFLLSGHGHQEELASLKGQYEALDHAAIQRNCSVAAEINSAQAPQGGTTARQ